jgi:hypothetical protein
VTPLPDSELVFLEAFSGLGSCNPFVPAHDDFERALLGGDYVSESAESLNELLVQDPYRRGTNFHLITSLGGRTST